jgi:hypothetical protein
MAKVNIALTVAGLLDVPIIGWKMVSIKAENFGVVNATPNIGI